MLITILGMIKPTAVQSQIRPFRLISGWKYARRSGSILIGQGCFLRPSRLSGILAAPSKSSAMPPKKPVSPATTSLARALDQNEIVKETVEHSADELLVINAVLKQEIPPHVQTSEVAQALEKTGELNGKIQASAEKLAQVNQVLEQEISERADLERELASTKAALAQAKDPRA
jgi:hypothetical protein